MGRRLSEMSNKPQIETPLGFPFGTQISADFRRLTTKVGETPAAARKVGVT
ncbi:hypothetical protein ES703_72699 [subsurface metagenome]